MILIKTINVFKTSDFGYSVVFGIVNNLNKELVNSVTVDADIFLLIIVIKPF